MLLFKTGNLALYFYGIREWNVLKKSLYKVNYYAIKYIVYTQTVTWVAFCLAHCFIIPSSCFFTAEMSFFLFSSLPDGGCVFCKSDYYILSLRDG